MSTVPSGPGTGAPGKPELNKTVLVVVIVAVVAVGTVLALLAATTLTVSKSNFAPYSSSVSQSSSPSSLAVMDVDGSITVIPWAQANVLINGTITARGLGASTDAIRFIANNSSGNIVFEVVFPGGTTFLIGSSYTVDISVYIPASARFNSAQFNTVNGVVKVSSITATTLTVTTTNGNVQASSISVSTLSLTATNGYLDISCTSCGSIAAITTNGQITATLSGPLSGSYTLTTTNGGISLSLPALPGFKITANTTNGTISASGLGVQLTNHVQASVGTGTATVSLTTTNGSIAVTGT